MDSREIVIRIRDLETRFGPALIHQNLDLDIRRGEILAIIGGSGTGKTTLMREIILLESPTSGSIQVFGREVLGMGDREALWLRERCGVMFQHGALFSSLTVAENVALPLTEHTKLSPSLVEELAALKIALVGLPPEAGMNYPDQLSGGMIKRAALARALALDPEIVFLDEPSAGLDPIGAGALDELILQLRDALGLTVVMVTHDLDSLWRVTDRIAILSEKRVLAVGPIAEMAKLDHDWTRDYFNGPRGRQTAAAYQ